jgi:hypothetical protein
MSDSLRERLDKALYSLGIYGVLVAPQRDELANTILPIIESEINKARREALDQAKECVIRVFTETYGPIGAKLKAAQDAIAQLSSVQQEAPIRNPSESILGNCAHCGSPSPLTCPCVAPVEQEAIPEGQCPHGYAWGDCAKCPPAVIDMPSPHVAPIPVNEPMCTRCGKMFLECQCDRATAPTDQEALKPNPKRSTRGAFPPSDRSSPRRWRE